MYIVKKLILVTTSKPSFYYDDVTVMTFIYSSRPTFLAKRNICNFLVGQKT